METQEVDRYAAGDNGKNNEQVTSEKDESGFDEDISACSIEDKTFNNESNSFPLSASTPLDKSFPLDNNRTDDSGIFTVSSVQSEITEGEVSGSLGDIDKPVNSEMQKDGFVENSKENNNFGDTKVKDCNSTAMNSKSQNVDNFTDNGELLSKYDDMEVIGDEEKVLANETSDNKSAKISDSKCDTDNSDSNDEDFSDFVKKTLKSRSHVRKLVDYEQSDSTGISDEDRNNCDESKTGKSKRNYRKRKPDSDIGDSDNEAKDQNAETDDVENGSGEPVLLRHSQLNDSGANNVVGISDLSSDSSDEELEDDRKVSHETSDSEPDDTPVDLSEFGPPKHKWKAIFDLRNRELGHLPTTGNHTGSFTRRVQGSLQMVQRFKLQYKMDHHEGCVNALHFNRSGTLLASGSDDLNVVIWNWIKNTPTLVYDSGHRSNVFQTKFMPYSGDCHVVSCARDGQVRLADLSSTGVCKGTKKLAQHRGAAHKLALENDTPHVVLSAGEDAVTFEIDLRQDKPNKLVTSKENDKKVSMYSIHSNPTNSHEFCLGGRDHFIRVYDKRKINEEVNDGLLKKFSPHHIAASESNNMKANVTCACYNYNGTEILGTYNDEDIYLFNNQHSDAANYIHRYRGHRNNQTVKGVNFYGAESEFIVSGSDCGHIFLWDKDTENIVQYMEGDEGGVVNVLEPHPTAPVLATSGLDHDVKIWAPTAEIPTKLKGLRKATKQNAREREEERTSDAGMIDGSMLWFIMHHLRQGRRRRAREARVDRGEQPADDDSSDTLSDEDYTTDEDSEADGESGQRDAISCNPS